VSSEYVSEHRGLAESDCVQLRVEPPSKYTSGVECCTTVAN
jgi:hypothetical protein